jgi:hypothetical protein
MAKRIIQSPGVEIQERDLSLRVPTPAGTTVYTTGFSDQGPTDEVLGISSLTEFERIYGTPKSAAERYFFHTVKAILDSQSKLLVNRLPYGCDCGEGFGSSVGLLAYPVNVFKSASANNTLSEVLTGSGSSSTFTNGTSGATYLIGKPTQFSVTPDEYLKIMNGQAFDWSNTPATAFTAISSLGSAGIIVVNKGQTTIDDRFGGYYLGLADNTNINPATNFDAVRSVVTVAQSANSTTPLSSFVTIPKSRLDFALSATSAAGDNPAVDSISQIMEEKITGYNIANNSFNDTLNLGLFKLRSSVFGTDASSLGAILEEGFNGSIGYNRKISNERGGEAINFFLENLENNSRNIDILVNPYMSNQFDGELLNDDGTPKNKVRIISKQLETALSAVTTTATAASAAASTIATATSAAALATYNLSLTSVALSADAEAVRNTAYQAARSTLSSAYVTIENNQTAAFNSFGIHTTQLSAAAYQIGYADSLFPLGAYGPAKVTAKTIGNVPNKLQRALDRVRNSDIFDIDIIAEGGLGTIWTYTNTAAASMSSYFDDTKTTPGIEALRTSNELVDTSARDAYNAIFSKYATFAGPIKDGGRGDILYIADPIRQILVSGKDSKVINNPSKNFSVDIYWALRHQFEMANTSYATVYANYFKVYDDNAGIYAYVPSSGFAAAKMVSTDADIGPWGAPAGFNRGIVTNALDVALVPNQRQRDDLYTVSLNPITTFPDQGIVFFGQKTLLKKPSAFDRINVRRNFLYLEKATKSVMKFFIFENNTLFTRTQVVNTLAPFFERVKVADGLYDYLIVCDERNNTPEVIDNNELVVDIYLKPVRTAEFIRVNFYATRTDANFQELIGG